MRRRGAYRRLVNCIKQTYPDPLLNRGCQVGKAFTTYDQPGNWWRVRLPDGTTGYIARSRIRLSGEPGAAGSGAVDSPDPGGEAPATKPSDMKFPDSSAHLLVASELAQLGPSMLRAICDLIESDQPLQLVVLPRFPRRRMISSG